MKFIYQIRTEEGEIREGKIDAPSREEALKLLQKSGFFVTYLDVETPSFLVKEIKILRKTSLKDIALFSRQIGMMIQAQIPIVESLKAVGAQTKNPELREAILDISQEVEGGSSLSRALSHHKEIFSPFYIATIRIGEKAGKLSDSFNYLASYLERTDETIARVKGALVYPALILIVATAIFLFLGFYVFPTFETILLESGIDIPLPTKIALLFFRFLREKFFILLFIFLIFLFPVVLYLKTEEGKRNLHQLYLKLPLLGETFKYSNLSYFCDSLATLISSGIMIVDALEISEEVVGNKVYKEGIAKIREGVKKGYPISTISSLYPNIFPPLFNQMVMVGERTGNLGQSFLQVANFYQMELKRMTENISRIIEPLMIIFIGLFVGGLMGSVIIPLYRIIGSY